ncbi:hypothetical protein K9M59_00815 [Candidatus Gracilibacteria bacterium]|nr:hypothetical protein [Candidatus Gracilibacteria bacterium]MCF7819119.1 hypothetical protein [Candidatus Gracilibacteria bacterium]
MSKESADTNLSHLKERIETFLSECFFIKEDEFYFKRDISQEVAGEAIDLKQELDMVEEEVFSSGEEKKWLEIRKNLLQIVAIFRNANPDSPSVIIATKSEKVSEFIKKIREIFQKSPPLEKTKENEEEKDVSRFSEAWKGIQARIRKNIRPRGRKEKN